MLSSLSLKVHACLAQGRSCARVQERDLVRRVLLEPCDGDLFSEPREHGGVTVRIVSSLHHAVGEQAIKVGVPLDAVERGPRHPDAIRVRVGECKLQTVCGAVDWPAWALGPPDVIRGVEVPRSVRVEMLCDLVCGATVDVIEVNLTKSRRASRSSQSSKEVIGYTHLWTKPDRFQSRRRREVSE